MRKPIQKEVIEKPNLQTIDEQNALTTSGENGDGVGNNPTNDANVNEFNCKQQLLILLPPLLHIQQNKLNENNNRRKKNQPLIRIFLFCFAIQKKSDSMQSNAAASCRVRDMLTSQISFEHCERITRNSLVLIELVIM